MKRRLPPPQPWQMCSTTGCPRPGSGPSGTTVSSCANRKSAPARVRVPWSGPGASGQRARSRSSGCTGGGMSLTGQGGGPAKSRSGSATKRRSLTRHEKPAGRVSPGNQPASSSRRALPACHRAQPARGRSWANSGPRPSQAQQRSMSSISNGAVMVVPGGSGARSASRLHRGAMIAAPTASPWIRVRSCRLTCSGTRTPARTSSTGRSAGTWLVSRCSRAGQSPARVAGSRSGQTRAPGMGGWSLAAGGPRRIWTGSGRVINWASGPAGWPGGWRWPAIIVNLGAGSQTARPVVWCFDWSALTSRLVSMDNARLPRRDTQAANGGRL